MCAGDFLRAVDADTGRAQRSADIGGAVLAAAGVFRSFCRGLPWGGRPIKRAGRQVIGGGSLP